jgi:hypothetical protein
MLDRLVRRDVRSARGAGSEGEAMTMVGRFFER